MNFKKIVDTTLSKGMCALLFDVLTILIGKDCCFTQFSTGMAGWLLLTFFICLHNQLRSIQSIISTVV